MTTNIVYVLRDKPLAEEFGFSPNKENAPAIIPPQGFIYGSSNTLTDDDLAMVQAGKKFYYIYGTLTYWDVFKGTPVHTTTFCRQITNILGNVHAPKSEIVEMFFAIVAPKHNTAD
jgi:hypothetical protein